MMTYMAKNNDEDDVFIVYDNIDPGPSKLSNKHTGSKQNTLNNRRVPANENSTEKLKM